MTCEIVRGAREEFRPFPQVETEPKFLIKKFSAAVAFITIPAIAGPVLDTGSCDTSVASTGTGTCSIIQVSPSGGAVDIPWLQLSGQTNAAPFEGDLAFARVNAQGMASGTILDGVAIPVSWDFIISDPDHASVNWSVFFELRTTADIFDFERDGTIGASGEVKGSGILLITTGGPLFNWSAGASATSATGRITLDVPAGSTLDFNPSTPEPASLYFTGAGAFALFLARLKQKMK